MSNSTNIRILLYLISVLSLPISLISQGTINPFDLKKSNKTSLFDTPIDSIKEERGTENAINPFNIIRSSAPDDKKKATTAYVPPFKKRQIELAKKSDGRFLFWTVTAILFLLTPIVSLYNNVIKKAYRGFLNASFLKMTHRDQGRFISFPYILLYLLFFINAGFFCFLTVRHFDETGVWDFKNLLYFVLGVSLVFLVKHFILKIVEGIFPVEKEVRLYSFTIIVFNIMLGLILIPLNIFVAFGPEYLIKALIYTGLGIILAFYIYRTFRGLFISSKFISFHKFHFFMYICTVEIAPVLILAKLLFIITGISW